MPGMVRSSRSTMRACSANVVPFSLASTNMYFSLDPPKPTFTRAPGSTASASRSSRSTCCFLMPPRSSRGVMLMVNVALRTSAAPCGTNGSLPAAPPPIAVYTIFTCGFCCTMMRACSAVARVCVRVLPGGSEIYTCVCDKSSGGRNPVGNNGTNANEPKKNTAAPSIVRMRCRRHHAAHCRYSVSQRGSRGILETGFRRYAAIIGVNMRATTSEKKTAIDAVQPNCTKNLPGTPPMNAVGKNTAISVNVVAMTARPISSAASIAA